MKPLLSVAAVSLITALALGLPGASAQSTSPQPCGGVMQITDPAGDQTRGDLPSGPASADITGVFFTHANDKTHVNLRISDLTAAAPEGATSLRWNVHWFVDDKGYYVQAVVGTSGTESYFYGDYSDADGQTYVGDTSGKMVEGANGLVQITIPRGIGGAAGKLLTQPFASTFEAIDTPAGYIGTFTDDRAPDDGAGTDYTVGACGGAGPATAAPPAPAPIGGGGPGEQSTLVGGLRVDVARKLPKAKAAARAKRVAVKLTSSEKVTDVKATLYAGAPAKARVFGTGEVAAVDGKATLKVKLKRKLKKGKYSLVLLGKNADGRQADKTVALKFR